MISNNVEQMRKKDVGIGKVRTYNEVVEYLDALKPYEYSEASVLRMKELDQALGMPTANKDIILVGGTNGKSTALRFASKLLLEEGLSVATAYSTHILTYNERLHLRLEAVSNKTFADLLNEVITVAEVNKIKATAHELLLISLVLHAKNEKIDVILLEVAYGGKQDAASYFNAKLASVTRVAEDGRGLLGEDLDIAAFEMLEIAKPGCWFISAEQSKIRLQKMKSWCDERHVKWAMPIRKLAVLPYIYEQLYGRVASLGERIAQIYVEDIKGKFSPFLRGNLLATQKGQRGRPTLEAKRHAELHPVKTLKHFWADQFELLHGRFEYLDKENPCMLLDNANNLDAFMNLFLGIRLLHYQKALKGLVLVIGLPKSVNAMEAIKLVRYLMKKVTGQMLFVPLPGDVASHDVNDLAMMAKELNVKAKACASLEEALSLAKTLVDERDGLIAVSGSNSLISAYWSFRGIKKF
jgi:folylpolyglutamate synthase/dihydropteroate synthase